MPMQQTSIRYAAAIVVFAVACGSSSHDHPVAPDFPPTHLVGQVVLGTGASVIPALRVTASASDAPAHNASATVDASGAFDFFAPIESWNATSVDLIVDAPAGTQRVFHPMLTHATPATAASAVARPFLVPEQVTFTSKTFSTATVAFSVRGAFIPVCTDVSSANCNSFYPASWRTTIPQLWPESALPIPVAFNRPGSSASISDADSIALWNNIGAMHDALGRQLYKPATLSDLGTPNDGGYITGAVLISIDNTLSPNAGYTNWRWDASELIFEAKTRVGSPAALSSRGLMTHELLHAQGFHHTCAWPSVMGGYGCPFLNGATVQDAAAFNLAWTLRHTMQTSSPSTFLADAALGEQQIELGIVASLVAPPLGARIPYAPAERRTTIVGGRLVTTDGAP